MPDQVAEVHPLWELAFAWFQRHRDAVRTLLAPFDLAPMPMHALRALAPGRPRPMVELAQLIHCDPANITSVVARLAERGLVVRVPDPHDGRVRAVLLTGEGEAVRDAIVAALAAPPPALDRLDAADRAELQRLLERALAPDRADVAAGAPADRRQPDGSAVGSTPTAGSSGSPTR